MHLFETFGVKSLYFAADSTMAVIGSGRQTGLSISSGESGSQVVPVFDGMSNISAKQIINFGGFDLD